MAGAVVTASTLAWTVGLVDPGPPQRAVGGGTSGADRTGPHPGRHRRHGLAAPARRAGLGGVRGLVRRRARDGPQLRADFAHDAAGRSARARGLGLGLPEPGRRPRHRPRRRRRRGRGGRGLAGHPAGRRRCRHRLRRGGAGRRRWRWSIARRLPGSLARTAATPVSR